MLTFNASLRCNGADESRPFSFASVKMPEEKAANNRGSNAEAMKLASWCLLMCGGTEQRYSIQQGHCLDNATQMGQEELSILTHYVTLIRCDFSSGPAFVGVGGHYCITWLGS